MVFDFKLSPRLIAEGVVACADRGLIGGLFPALRAGAAPLNTPNLRDYRSSKAAGMRIREPRFYSPLEVLAARINSPHLRVSSSMNLPNSAAVPGRASSPRATQLLLHLGIGKHANNLRLQPIDDRAAALPPAP